MAPKEWKGSVIRRGGKLYLKYKTAEGNWTPPVATGLEVGQEAAAKKLLARIREREQCKAPYTDAAEGAATVRSYAKKWIERRKENTSWQDDESVLKHHVYPAIGSMPIAEVRPRHLLALIDSTKKKLSRLDGKPLAGRTVRNVYSVCCTLFRDAMIEDLIEASPCVLRGKHLPAARDKDPEWRDTAVFSLHEVERICSDPAIPEDRRVFYALMMLGCCRFGEAAALRWRHCEAQLEPLGKLRIAKSYSTRLKSEKSTKAERPRAVPVIPALAKMLAEWRLSGWPKMFGRVPTADDLIVPSREGHNRSSNHMLQKFHEDLDRLSLRRRRQHDSRRTWLSVVLAAGANDTHAKWIAHGPPPSVLGAYLTMPWPTLCKVVDGLRVDLQYEAQVFALPRAAAGGGRAPTGLEATIAARAETSPFGADLVQWSQAADSAKESWRGVRDSNPWPPA